MTIEGSMTELAALEMLKLSNNRIKALPKDLFRHLVTLKTLDLGGNLLESLDPTVFHNLTALEVILLHLQVCVHLCECIM